MPRLVLASLQPRTPARRRQNLPEPETSLPPLRTSTTTTSTSPTMTSLWEDRERLWRSLFCSKFRLRFELGRSKTRTCRGRRWRASTSSMSTSTLPNILHHRWEGCRLWAWKWNIGKMITGLRWWSAAVHESFMTQWSLAPILTGHRAHIALERAFKWPRAWSK